jgi:hypothetical protein
MLDEYRTRTHDLDKRPPTAQRNALKYEDRNPNSTTACASCFHDNRKTDPELAEIDDAWIGLPKAIQQTMLAMVRSFPKGRVSECNQVGRPAIAVFDPR